MSKKNLYVIVSGCGGETYLTGITESKEVAEKIKEELQTYIDDGDWIVVMQTPNLDVVDDYKCRICLNCMLVVNIFDSPPETDKRNIICIYTPLDLAILNTNPGEEYEDSIEDVGLVGNKHNPNWHHKKDEEERMKCSFIITIRRPLIDLPQFASIKEKYNFFYDKAIEALKVHLGDEFPKDAIIAKEYFDEDGDTYVEEEK